MEAVVDVEEQHLRVVRVLRSEVGGAGQGAGTAVDPDHHVELPQRICFRASKVQTALLRLPTLAGRLARRRLLSVRTVGVVVAWLGPGCFEGGVELFETRLFDHPAVSHLDIAAVHLGRQVDEDRCAEADYLCTH
jgi:hypothetical protein